MEQIDKEVNNSYVMAVAVVRPTSCIKNSRNSLSGRYVIQLETVRVSQRLCLDFDSDRHLHNDPPSSECFTQ